MDVFVPWFEIQIGLPGKKERPHGFARLVSVTVASPGTSETRSVRSNRALAIPPLAQSTTMATAPVMAGDLSAMIWSQRALLCDFDARAAVQPALFRPSAVLYSSTELQSPLV